MTVVTICSHCSLRYSVKKEYVGKEVTCKRCQRRFIVASITDPEFSPSGDPIFRHEAKGDPIPIVDTATEFLPAIERHIEQTIGPAPRVWHEIVSPEVHMDLHVVPAQPKVAPSEDRPLGGDYITVVTSGMSTRPMKLPNGAKEDGLSQYAELMIALPKDWPGLNPDGTFDQVAMKDERNWWPFRWLKQIARLPHQFDTFLCKGHTIPNGENADPFAPGTDLACWLVFVPMLATKARQLVVSDDVRIDFFALFPLMRDEMELKLNKGLDALLEALGDGDVMTELIDPRRKSVLRKKWWFKR